MHRRYRRHGWICSARLRREDKINRWNLTVADRSSDDPSNDSRHDSRHDSWHDPCDHSLFFALDEHWRIVYAPNIAHPGLCPSDYVGAEPLGYPGATHHNWWIMIADGASTKVSPAPAFDRFEIWGTSVVLGVTDPEVLSTARAILDGILQSVEQAASRFRPGTEIQAVNAFAGNGPLKISATLFDLISHALRAAEITNGACDPTVADSVIALGYDRDFDALDHNEAAELNPTSPAPGIDGIILDSEFSSVSLPAGVHLDLGATAKARTSDRAAEAIAETLSIGVLVDIGGDLRVAGPCPEEGWVVGVTKSARRHGESDIVEAIAVRDGGIASSSSVVRAWNTKHGAKHHLIDPRTGNSATTPFAMCTVVAATCVDANAFSTAAMVWGEDALFEIAQLSLPARFERLDGTVERIASWPEPHDAMMAP
jgi:thiamine biosynthesis lipoprotein